MQKIPFQDLPNKTTPISSSNLNLLQDNVEDAIDEIKNIELLAVSDIAPSECSTGDKYYNTSTKKIYTATSTDTWGTTGENPISGVFYIVFDEQSSYSWDGTDLVSVGGGKEDIVIDDEEPTDPDVKIWIDTGELESQASEITNSYSTSTGIGYSANYINKLINGTTLYEDNTGTETTVTLNDNTANYDYIEIFYKSANYAYNSVKVPTSANYITLQANTFDINNSSNIGIFFMFKELQNNGTSLTIRSNNRLYKYKNENAFTQDTTANIQIIKVIGYKEEL